MAIESVTEALSDADLLQAWSSFMGQLISTDVVGLAVRFVLSRKPRLTYEIAAGPAKADVEGFLYRHPVMPGTTPGLRVVPWKRRMVAYELKDVPAGVYATGDDEGLLEEVVTDFCHQPAVREALEHSYRILGKDVERMKRTATLTRDPCLLIDDRRQVHAVNLAAKALLADGIGNLGISAGDQLSFTDRAANARFVRMIEAFFSGLHEEGRTLINSDLLALVSRDRSGYLPGERLVLLHLRKLRQPLVLDATRVADMTRLTMSQARLACALVRGRELRQYAEESGIRISTARWHMRKALSNMECESQHELVALLKEIFG